jgi:hypothetical protein
MNRIARPMIATFLFVLTAGLVLCGCKSRDELMIEKLHSPFDIDHEEAIWYFGTEVGAPALTTLKEEMNNPDLRQDIRRICEGIGTDAIEPLLTILHEDTAATPFPYKAEEMFLNAPQDIITFGDHAGLIRAGTATECLWSIVGSEDIDRFVDLYLQEPAQPERPFAYSVLRRKHDEAWKLIAKKVKSGLSAEKSHKLIRYLMTAVLTQEGSQAIDSMTGDMTPEALEGLLAFSDPPSRSFYLNGMAYEHNDPLIETAMEQFKKEAKENPDDPIPPFCVGALMVVQNAGVDRKRIAERWLDKSRIAYFENEKELGWTSFDRVIYMEAMAHYYGGILQWWAVTMQDYDRVDELADRQRDMLHPAEDMKDAVKPKVIFAKEAGETANDPGAAP